MFFAQSWQRGADGDDSGAFATEFANLTDILTSAWSGISFKAVQGNHDLQGMTGEWNSDSYRPRGSRVLINEASFPWWQGDYGSGKRLSPVETAEADILKAVRGEYEVTEDQAAADIAVFLGKLRKMNII